MEAVISDRLGTPRPRAVRSARLAGRWVHHRLREAHTASSADAAGATRTVWAASRLGPVHPGRPGR